ncbi:uncharacterized protein LOC132653803 [Meriones unguiculatus]|uniref:uncharacterized protein LOC132653803 n=1 Tax=Meriones unguiculatus TaxID=10047 RepID=UPI00293F0E6C|nr:uncharacterized protein LOC132653803 [Meriones unguiculatus]
MPTEVRSWLEGSPTELHLQPLCSFRTLLPTPDRVLEAIPGHPCPAGSRRSGNLRSARSAQPPHGTQVSRGGRGPRYASARPARSNRSQTPPSQLSSRGNLTLASRRRRAPTYSFVVQLLAKLKLLTPLPRLRGRGLGRSQRACADRPAELRDEGREGARCLRTWTAAGKGHLGRGMRRCPGSRPWEVGTGSCRLSSQRVRASDVLGSGWEAPNAEEAFGTNLGPLPEQALNRPLSGPMSF